MNYWLMKSEPDVYPYSELVADGRTHWDGVRNYQARNFMRQMELGDRVLFYHSNAKPLCIAGFAEVVRTVYPDFTAWDPNDNHFDPKSSEEKPRWEMVDIAPLGAFDPVITRDELKQSSGLDGLELLRKGSRLSVQPVSQKHFERILSLRD